MCILNVPVCTILQEITDEAGIAIAGCIPQCCPLPIILEIEVGASPQQQLGHLVLTIPCCSDKGCEVTPSSDVDINSELEEEPHHTIMPLLCTDVEGSVVFVILSGL